jgi:hypothetical protein
LIINILYCHPEPVEGLTLLKKMSIRPVGRQGRSDQQPSFGGVGGGQIKTHPSYNFSPLKNHYIHDENNVSKIEKSV